MILLTILVTVAILFVAFVLYNLERHPITVTINVVTPQVAAARAAAEASQPAPHPLPESIVEYADQESDEWAREARKRRARGLYAELQNWDAVLRQLEREDNPPS